MATLQKIGYKQSGYTESFITPVPITSGTALIGGAATDYGIGNGLVPIENSQFRNAGLYLRIKTGATASSFVATEINFDTRQDSRDDGKFVVYDGTDYRTVDTVEQIVDNTGSYPVIEWNITLSGAITVVDNQVLKVVGRVPDCGAVTASKNYVAGDLVTEVYPAEGSYTP